MRTLFAFLLRFPRVAAILVIGLVSAITGGTQSGTFSSSPESRQEARSSDPWAKDYAPAEMSASEKRRVQQLRANRGSNDPWYSGEIEDATSVEEYDEIQRDEAFRREMLREWRKEYESQNGSVEY